MAFTVGRDGCVWFSSLKKTGAAPGRWYLANGNMFFHVDYFESCNWFTSFDTCPVGDISINGFCYNTECPEEIFYAVDPCTDDVIGFSIGEPYSFDYGCDVCGRIFVGDACDINTCLTCSSNGSPYDICALCLPNHSGDHDIRYAQ